MTTPVTFRITTYYKRRRNEAGLTQLASTRITMGEALNWLLGELPDNAVRITHDGDEVTLVLNWSRVPEEIRTGKASR